MIVINIADIHGNSKPISELGEILSSADLILLSGDITHFGGKKEAAQIINEIRNYNSNILAVTGNCDTDEVDTFLEKEDMQIHGRAIDMDDVTIFGAGGSLPCPNPTPNIYSEEEYAAIFGSSVQGMEEDSPKIMVSHNPPIDTLNDTLDSGAHVGSKTVRSVIEETKPLVCFTGHIHEAAGIDEIGSTKIVNPGPLGTRSYAYLDITDKINSLEIKKF